MPAPTPTLSLDGATLTVRDGGEVRTHRSRRAPAPLMGEGTFDPPTTPLDADGQGVPYATYAFAAQIATVEVDIELGTVKVLRIVAAHDVGRAINPTLVEGQIQGGIAQGLGLALMEEYLPGRTENLHDYLIPTIGDVPEIECILIEDREPLGPSGAKGVGEPGLVPTAPAILGAIHHATGVRVHRVPAAAAPAARSHPRAKEKAAMSDDVWRSARPNATPGIVRCDACPVLCRIRPGRAGACDRYANEDGKLVRIDPLVLLAKPDLARVAFVEGSEAWARRARQGRGRLRHRHRRHHDLSRLQAGAVHRRRRSMTASTWSPS